jgi:5-hydroxyisourate hydrolase
MGISTHVLNTAIGRPAAGVQVALESQDGEGWRLLQHAATDSDGRCKQMLAEADALEDGIYRLRFETGAYFAGLGVRGLYPFVEISFEVRSGEGEHYHIPLLLTANGYTTYRGS